MDIIQKAQKLADEILKLTLALELSGADAQEEADIDAYIKMVEAREPLVAELVELKQNIDEVLALTEEYDTVLQTIKMISDKDEEHHDFMENVREAVQGALRKVKHGQKIHQGYQSIPEEATSRRFDTRH